MTTPPSPPPPRPSFRSDKGPAPGAEPQAKRPSAVGAPVLFAMLVIVGLLFVVRLGTRRNPAERDRDAVMTSAERTGLTVTPESLSHAVIGFALPAPGPGFTTPDDMRARLDSLAGPNPALAVWGFQNAEGSATLVVQATKFAAPVSEQRLRQFAGGFRSSFTKSGTALTDTIIWQGGRGEFDFVGDMNGAYLATRCLTRSGRDASYIVCVQGSGLDTTLLAPQRAGLRVWQ